MITTTSRLSLLALLLPLAGACSTAPTVPGGGPARPSDCPLEFLYSAPARPYEPLGDLFEHVTLPPRGSALEALRPRACALGADALIVTRNQVLNAFGHTLVEGTAIRWRREPTPAPAAPQPPASPPSGPQGPAPQSPTPVPPQARPLPPELTPVPPQARPLPPELTPVPPQARPLPPELTPAPTQPQQAVPHTPEPQGPAAPQPGPPSR